MHYWNSQPNLCDRLPLSVPLTPYNENLEAVNLTCVVPCCGPVRWLMCCPLFQGRDELGDHAGGPSEKDHEQHTDYEGPDAPSPRHRCPGVTGTGHLGQGRSPKQSLPGAAPGTFYRDLQSKQTSVMSDSSGCVRSEIIPLFLSEGLWSASSEGTQERKRATQNKTVTKKETTWTRLFFVLFFVCLWGAYRLNHISNGTLEIGLTLMFL